MVVLVVPGMGVGVVVCCALAVSPQVVWYVCLCWALNPLPLGSHSGHASAPAVHHEHHEHHQLVKVHRPCDAVGMESSRAGAWSAQGRGRVAPTWEPRWRRLWDPASWAQATVSTLSVPCMIACLCSSLCMWWMLWREGLVWCSGLYCVALE